MMRDGVSVFGIELYLKSQKPTTLGLQGWKQIQVPIHAILWQKEALWNTIAESLPEEYDKFVFLDADLWFENENWLQKTSDLLDQVDFVQPFSHCIWTGEDGLSLRDSPSAFSIKQSDRVAGHVGFGVAMTRKGFDGINGFYEHSVCGNGDTIMASGMLGIPLSKLQLEITGGTLDAKLLCKSWVDNAALFSMGKVGWTQGGVWHEWHGSRDDRKYVERKECVKSFNPLEHIEKHQDGYMIWSQEAPPEMMAMVKNYFTERKEDGKA